MPKTCEVLEVTPLLRELIVRATELPIEYEERGPAGRVMRLLLDELAALPRLPYNLPMPKSAPLARDLRAPDGGAGRSGDAATTWRRATAPPRARWRATSAATPA